MGFLGNEIYILMQMPLPASTLLLVKERLLRHVNHMHGVRKNITDQQNVSSHTSLSHLS